jgi:hypothetical protein
VAEMDQSWLIDNYGADQSLYELAIPDKYLICVYKCLLSMLGNDIHPSSLPLLILANFSLILGLIILANLLASIFSLIFFNNYKHHLKLDQIK